MTAFLNLLAWEWVNIALEVTATVWVRLPHFVLAVAGVNLLTHPLLTCVLTRFGTELRFVLACEACVVLVEWGVLTAVYGWRRWRFLGWVSVLMNGVSYGTGVLLA